MTDVMPAKEITLHGHQVCYREAGEGPPLVLIHGITSNSETWREVMPWLAKRHRVIAPDLMGHGDSAKPRGDYSLGSYASGIRDLIVSLGVDRATIVGHSLGGGIAMQFAYQFPERCERLVLVSSGGLGREVNPLLRAASLPGSEFVLPVIAAPRLLEVGFMFGRLLNRLGLKPAPDIAEIARGYASLGDVSTRQAFLHTLRGVIDPRGQRVSALDRLYLAREVPSLIVWGARDPVIPMHHGEAAHREMPGSRFEIFPSSGHFPQLEQPREFVELIEEFVAGTKPARLEPEELRGHLLQASAAAGKGGKLRAIPSASGPAKKKARPRAKPKRPASAGTAARRR